MIEFKQVTLIYDDPLKQRDFTALEELNVTLKKGNIYGIIGENGSGKSTFLSLLTGMIRPTKGQILFNNRPLSEQRLSYFERIGYCPQQADSVFFNKTVLDELTFSTQEEAAIHEHLEHYQLASVATLSPFQLSSGQKKKLQYVLATINQPEILILDEVMAGLDSQSKQLLLSDIRSYRNQRYTVMVSHDLETVLTYADQILFIHQQSLIFTGSPNELLKRSDLLQKTGFPLPDIYPLQDTLENKKLITNTVTRPTAKKMAIELINQWGATDDN